MCGVRLAPEEKFASFRDSELCSELRFLGLGGVGGGGVLKNAPRGKKGAPENKKMGPRIKKGPADKNIVPRGGFIYTGAAIQLNGY